MSYNPQLVPPIPEQDSNGTDDLPTYDDLAQQHGPNSRFGRWRGWVEKRAAERYADFTPDDFHRRRARGWGDSNNNPAQDNVPVPFPNLPQGHHLHPTLHLQTAFDFSQAPISPFAHTNRPPAPAALIPDAVSPSQLNLYNFGSRFLPHTTSPIRCLLPLSNHHLLLIGHDNGLSVLDMFPQRFSEDGEPEKGPADAEAKLIWEGEGVYQMNILEAESTGEGTPQGVVLALVGTDTDQEANKTLRMYNLASLVSLAKWAVTQKGARPLDLRGSKSTNGHGHGKKHRPPSSLTRSLKNLMSDQSSSPSSSSSRGPDVRASYSSMAETWSSSNRPGSSLLRADSLDSEWDVVNDLPLRWATHYTPLASSGSKLQNTTVVGYDMWRNENHRGRGGVLLAVATKSSILMYEAPKGERAFRLTKEFYTPIPARNITFIHQAVQDMTRSPSDVHPRTVPLDSHPKHARVVSFGAQALSSHPTQLSLFVIFEKKAGTIRIADSAVGEVDLYEDAWASSSSSSLLASPTSAGRRNRASWDGRGFAREKGAWVRPVRVEFPVGAAQVLRQLYVLTRGRQSHLVAHPLPSKVSSFAPVRIFHWTSVPNSIGTRLCARPRPASTDSGEPGRVADGGGLLQVIAFSDDGVEVQEIPLSTLDPRNRFRIEEPVRAQTDVNGMAGFLGAGGRWDRPFYPQLARSQSTASYDSEYTLHSDLDNGAPPPPRLNREGVYGWVQKGVEDWRVVWLGDAPRGEDDDLDDDDI